MSIRPIVLIDPGHGRHDSGAVNQITGTREKDVVLSDGKALQRALIKRGVDARMTRENDSFLNLQERANLANQLGAPLISLHCNASTTHTGNGFEAFTSPGQTGSDELATKMLEAYAGMFNLKPRYDLRDGDPDKEARFTVLTKTIGISVLFELGFIDHPGDENFLVDPNFRERRADVLADAIVSWLVDTEGFVPAMSPAKAVVDNHKPEASGTLAKPDSVLLLQNRIKVLEGEVNLLKSVNELSNKKISEARKALG